MARTNLTEKELRNGVFDQTKLTNLQTKLAEHDTALDTLEGNSDYKTSVRFATTANINLASTGLTAIDGVTPVAGNRALVKDQSAPAENGIYIVGATSWSRAGDANASAEVTSGMQVFVSEGTANAGKWYILTTADAITLGTTSLTFTLQPNAADLASTAASKGASLIGVQDAATIYTGANVEACLAEVKVLADAAVGAVKRTVTVDEEALSGASQAVNIGAALPANAIVFAHEIIVNEQGALAGNDLTITIGGTDADAIVASTDLDALAAGKYQGTLGVHPRGSFASEQLTATFAAGDLATLSAGNWTINVWYFVLA